MREALKLALDYIVATNKSSEFWLIPASNLNKTVTAIKEALAQPEQEPVVWMYQDKSTHEVRFQKHMRDFVDHGATYETPLYTTPPQLEREPVAWSYWQSCLNDDGTQTAPWVHRLSKFKPNESIINKDVTPLYTAPPQRTWVGLTDEEIVDAYDVAKVSFKRSQQGIRGQMLTSRDSPDWHYAKAIEAKLKEKNGYAEEKNNG